jgi:peptide/nickel transport system substrate-binding protein
VTDDAKVWRLSLRDGVRFHDGTPFDAEAMAFALRRMQRPDIGATLGAPAVWGQYLGGAEITVTGPLEVTIALAQPIADLLDILASAYALPPGLADREDFLKAPVGTGAYRVARVDAGVVDLEANRAWWGGPQARERLTFRAVEGSAARIAAVTGGGADLAPRVDPATIPRGAGTPERVHVYADPTAIIYILNAASGPFADARVRRAANLALDRTALIDEVLGGRARPLNAIVSPAHLGADDTAPPATDRAGARALLRDAGYGDGVTLVCDCPTRLPDEAQTLTRALAAQLATVGIALQTHIVEDRVAYAEAIRDKRIHDLCVFDSSPMSTYRVLFEKIDSRVRGSWWEGYANPRVEAALDRARATANDTAREALYAETLAMLREDPPWLALYMRDYAAVWRDPTHRWVVRADGVLDVTL